MTEAEWLWVRARCHVCFERAVCLQHGLQVLCAACLDALYPKRGAR